MRFSGTESVLRLTVEADSPEKAAELLDWLKGFVTARPDPSGATPCELGGWSPDPVARLASASRSCHADGGP
jgi:hypothetical protein